MLSGRTKGRNIRFSRLRRFNVSRQDDHRFVF